MTATTTDPFTVPDWEDQEIPEMPPPPPVGESPLAPPPADPEAPWGYKPNGQPYQRDPSVYARRSAGQQARRGRPPGGGVPKAPGKRAGSTKPPPTPDYATAISGLFQLTAFAVGTAGRLLRMPALLADAAGIAVHHPPVAAALGDLAMENAAFAAVLDKVAVAGPYAALITAIIPMGLQILVNHKGGPVPEEMTRTFGVRSRDDLLGAPAGAPA